MYNNAIESIRTKQKSEAKKSSQTAKKWRYKSPFKYIYFNSISFISLHARVMKNGWMWILKSLIYCSGKTKHKIEMRSISPRIFLDVSYWIQNEGNWCQIKNIYRYTQNMIILYFLKIKNKNEKLNRERINF